MDKVIRQSQLQLLSVFAKGAKDFALAGGTALELYYLQHRFSFDLDFFSANFSFTEVKKLVNSFSAKLGKRFKLEAEFHGKDRARVMFYTVQIRGASRPLKVDFVQDVLISKPQIKLFSGVRVYSAKDIYLQKISAIGGSRVVLDDIGRETMEGARTAARDVFDLYNLSIKVMPLYLFLSGLPRHFQRGMVRWYRTFSRQDLKLDLIDLDIYGKRPDGKQLISYLEGQIQKFMEKTILTL